MPRNKQITFDESDIPRLGDGTFAQVLLESGVYDFIMDGKERSPAYDVECRRPGATRQSIARELDRDPEGAASQAFEVALIKKLQKELSMTPTHVGDVAFDPETLIPRWHPRDGGKMKLWCPLDFFNEPPDDREYAVGCDIAMGGGGASHSNSVACVLDGITGEQVAEFATNTLPPAEFCDYCIAVCRFFGGKSGTGAYLIWEVNGPGATFTRRLEERGYGNVYRRAVAEQFGNQKTKKLGWHSRANKRMMLEEFEQSMRDSKIVMRCEEVYNECLQYEVVGNTFEHSRTKKSQDPRESNENHGDRVIAAGLANHARIDRPSLKSDYKEIQERQIPHNCMYRRLKDYDRDREERAQNESVFE